MAYPRRYEQGKSALWLVPLVLAVAGCAAMASHRLAGQLGQAILNQDDPATVRAGAPAYLLLLDGLIEDSPNDPALLTAGARLYGAYASAFVEEPERARRLSARARDYARRALCLGHAELCAKDQGRYDEFAPALVSLTRADVPLVYTYAAAWAGWIEARRGDWTAVADLPKVEALMRRVAALDETFERGRAHLYLGVMRTQLPPALGGRPEDGRVHFERAIALSHDRDLVAKVEFAERYARLMFDRALHDRLLDEVVRADPKEPGLTLSNILAQERARRLLATAAEYFQE